MNGTPAELASLALAAAGMRTPNHGRYLAELLRWYRHASLRGPVDPLDALDLAVALWKTPFAHRREELAALNEVGRWLEATLKQDPTISAERLAWRIGWLRRMAHPDESRPRGGPRFDERPGMGDRRGNEPSRRFGIEIEAMRRRRAGTPANESRLSGPTKTPEVELAALVRLVDKGNAAAKVPELLESVPVPRRPALARAIVARLEKKWVNARMAKDWAAQLLALAATT